MRRASATPRPVAITIAITLAIVALLVGLGVTRDALAAGERISAYTVAATIEADGGVRVQETIVYDFGDAERHGIFRDLVTRQRYDDRYDRIYALSDVTVTSPDGAATPTAVERTETGGTTRLRIGDANRTIRGVHTYVIGYRLRGTLNGFEDHDERDRKSTRLNSSH